MFIFSPHFYILFSVFWLYTWCIDSMKGIRSRRQQIATCAGKSRLFGFRCLIILVQCCETYVTCIMFSYALLIDEQNLCLQKVSGWTYHLDVWCGCYPACSVWPDSTNLWCLPTHPSLLYTDFSTFRTPSKLKIQYNGNENYADFKFQREIYQLGMIAPEHDLMEIIRWEFHSIASTCYRYCHVFHYLV